MKSKLIKSIVAVVVVVGVCFGGYQGYNTYFTEKTVVAAEQILTSNVRKTNLQVSVQGTGSAYAANTKEVMPTNNGTVQDLNVKVGDTVTAGQTLFVSDSDDIRKNVSTATNNLAKQNLTLASEQSAEVVDANKVASAKLSVSDAKAELTAANAQLTKMKVTAPIGGVITALSNSNGDSVQSSKSVLTIVDMTSIKIKVSVDELDINKIKIGQKAEIKFDALEGKTFEGAVEEIAQQGTSSNNVTNYDVVVSVSNPEAIKLGMNANVNILVESKENALVIPAEALVETNGKKYVRIKSTDSVSSQNNSESADSQANKSVSGNLVEVKTGLETETYIEITEGVTEGQKVIVQSAKTSSSTTTSKTSAGIGSNMAVPAMQGGSTQGGNSGASKN